MKNEWLAYLTVVVLSIGAGVAIAGAPNNVPVDATIVPPSTTVAPVLSVPVTTVPTTTQPPTTEPAVTTPPTTEPSTTSEPPTTGSVPPELAERSEFSVAAANGANIAGTAQAVAEQLNGLGYVDVVPLNGSTIVDTSTVHHADGLEEAARRLAVDLGLPPEAIAPLADAPEVLALPADTQLLVYAGVDLA